MKIFLSHYHQEASDAEDIADHLRKVFRKQDVEVILATGWETLAPGDRWEEKLIGVLEKANALIVLMSVDALGRPWLNFEMGVAWAKRIRILIFCHKGLTISGLPRPYSSLQAIDINNLKHNEKMDIVASAIANALNLSIPCTTPETTSIQSADLVEGASFASTYRTWSLRPGAHINETIKGHFLVGAVNPARPDRAKLAKLKPEETLYVRLFMGSTPEGRFIPALVTGKVAGFFERVIRDTTRIEATLRLIAVCEEGENTIPLVSIESYKVITESE